MNTKLTICDFCNIIHGEVTQKSTFDYVYSVSIYIFSQEIYDTFIAIDGRKYTVNDGGFGNTGNEDSVIGLRGTKDSHADIIKAISRGARTVVYDSNSLSVFYPDVNYIRVEDSMEALAELARYIIARSNLKVVGITGSTGKTTMVRTLADSLSEKFVVSVVEYIRTSYIGLAWHIVSALPQNCDYLIIEMQIDGKGQIDRFCKITKLDYAILINVNYAHIERFGSVEEILYEKLGVYRGLKETGKLFINVNNDLLSKWWLNQKDHRIIPVGSKESAEYFLKSISRDENYNILDISVNTENLEGESISGIRWKLGKQTTDNAMLAAAVLHQSGMEEYEIINALEKCKTPIGRLQGFCGIHNSKILVDSYNASYESTINGIELVLRSKYERKILIIGSLLELGKLSEQVHRNIGCYINEHGNFDYIIAMGEATLYILEEINCKKTVMKHFYSYQTIVEYLQTINLNEKTVIYIKGSGAMRMEIIAMYLLADETDI